MNPVAALLIASLAAAPPAARPADRQKPASPFDLSCAAPSDAMCRALARALAADGRAFRVVAAGAKGPAGGPSLTFVEERRSASSVEGHLAWVAADGRRGRDRTMTFSVSDSGLNDAMLDGFARSLLHESLFPSL